MTNRRSARTSRRDIEVNLGIWQTDRVEKVDKVTGSGTRSEQESMPGRWRRRSTE
jgi:hypothetical protein